MLRRRELLLGAGVAALGACVPRLREPTAPAASGAVPRGAAARPTPFAAGVTIDAAAAVNLVWPDAMDPAEISRRIAGALAAARASGLSAVVTTVAPSGRFWLDDAAFEKTRRDIAAWG
jgi:membrane dipeptidase